ncbi:hypothetical protein V1478_001404 [Vespula squamosa]|uniref:Uncharacterized protein n=1 Tax=Vespula squamosa TaxID=30214 RepID=A0ABD2C1C4_VESSQ
MKCEGSRNNRKESIQRRLKNQLVEELIRFSISGGTLFFNDRFPSLGVHVARVFFRANRWNCAQVASAFQGGEEEEEGEEEGEGGEGAGGKGWM